MLAKYVAVFAGRQLQFTTPHQETPILVLLSSEFVLSVAEWLDLVLDLVISGYIY